MKTKTISVPLNNNGFLDVISNSFCDFLQSGTSRSTAKLKPLHGTIAKDLAQRLGVGYYIQSQGWGDDKEGDIQGRYVDKKVDITVCNADTKEAIAGIAVKFVMQNYAQNSNNYFESMLGETANIRANHYPYFQIFIILDRLPYYQKSKNKDTKQLVIHHWETFTEHNAAKYAILSQDKIDMFFHTPNKTLLYVVHIADNNELLGKTTEAYMDFYKQCNTPMCLSPNRYPNFGNSIILNDYETFIDKVYHTIKAL